MLLMPRQVKIIVYLVNDPNSSVTQSCINTTVFHTDLNVYSLNYMKPKLLNT